MSDHITTVQQVEAAIGGAPALGVKMKIIDHLDASADAWLGQTTLAFIGIGKPDGPRVTLAGAAAGFVRRKDANTLTLRLDTLDDPRLPEPGDGAGVLCLVPGIGETLRANGRVRSCSAPDVDIAIEECFIHCAKALIRSAFWDASPAAAPQDPAAFVNATRFLALATMDRRGLIDISPKGDPAGLLLRLAGDQAQLAERPGNKLAFGYRNIVENPRIAALAIAPGSSACAVLEGRAHLTASETTRTAFAVEGKTPRLVTVIEGVRPQLRESRALARAAPWSSPAPAPTLDPAEALVAHVKLNKEQGAAATMLRLAINRGLVASGLKANYKSELY